MKRSEILLTTVQSLVRGEGDPPPSGDPPADPPAGDPPAGDPPAGDPPAGDPPAGDPPAGDDAWRQNLPENLRDKPAEELVEVFNQTQPPAAADQYTYQLGENTTYTDSEFGVLRDMMHQRVGLNDQQFSAFMKVMEEGREMMTVGREKVATRERETALQALSDDIGAEEANVAVTNATNFLRRTADGDFINFLEETGLGNDTRVIKYFSLMNTLISEDALRGFTPAPASKQMERTPGGTPQLDFPSMSENSEN